MPRWFALVALAFIAASAAGGASAQTCDDRFPLTCLFSPFLQPQPPDADRRSRASRSIWRHRRPSRQRRRKTRRCRRTNTKSLPATRNRYASLYAPMGGERFPIPAVNLSSINPQYLRQAVYFPTREQPGTIVIDPRNHFLYLVQSGGRAIRYGVGVGRQGFEWSGSATIHNKQEWPDWYPPKEMMQRQPELARQMSELQSGIGMPGGSAQPARRPRHLPLAGQQGHALPHPRHRRTVDHREKRVVRLYPHDQPGCYRSVPAHGGRHAGRGAVRALIRALASPLSPVRRQIIRYNAAG